MMDDKSIIYGISEETTENIDSDIGDKITNFNLFLDQNNCS
jgi:hypothetical protein